MQVFEGLVRGLPEAWADPAPEKPLISMGIQDSQCLILAFSRDCTYLAAGYSDGRIEIWQAPTARLIISLATNAGSIGFLAFASDNSYLILGGKNGTLTCSGIPSGNTVWCVRGQRPPGFLYCDVWKRGGDHTGDNHGRTIRIGYRTGKTLLEVQGHPSRVTAISPAPDGTSIVFGHADGTICSRDNGIGAELWAVPVPVMQSGLLNTRVRKIRLFVVYEHSLPVSGTGAPGCPCGHTPGSLVILHAMRYRLKTICPQSAATIAILRLWKWQEKNPTAEVPFYSRLPTCCAFTPDGTMTAVGCNEGTVYFFSVPEGRRIKEFRGYRQMVTSCAISQDGKTLATAGGDGAVTLRRIPSGELLRTL